MGARVPLLQVEADFLLRLRRHPVDGGDAVERVAGEVPSFRPCCWPPGRGRSIAQRGSRVPGPSSRGWQLSVWAVRAVPLGGSKRLGGGLGERPGTAQSGGQPQRPGGQAGRASLAREAGWSEPPRVGSTAWRALGTDWRPDEDACRHIVYLSTTHATTRPARVFLSPKGKSRDCPLSGAHAPLTSVGTFSSLSRTSMTLPRHRTDPTYTGAENRTSVGTPLRSVAGRGGLPSHLMGDDTCIRA